MTPWTVAQQAFLLHGDSPGKNTGVSCYALLQEIFPTQGSNPGSCIAGEFFTNELRGGPQMLISIIFFFRHLQSFLGQKIKILMACHLPPYQDFLSLQSYIILSVQIGPASLEGFGHLYQN